MDLRYYQGDCITAIYDFFRRFKTGNPIAALPTGTGKSFVIAFFLRGIFRQWPHQRVLVLTHVKELIAQNYAELLNLWPMAPAGIYSAGLGKREVRPITVAGIASVVGKGILFGHVDLVIIDECHLVPPDAGTEYQGFIAELQAINPRVRVVGLTATPYRLGQGLLTEPVWKEGKLKPALFTDICYDITSLDAFNRLIAEGYLCNLIPRPTETKLDVSQVKIVGGDFVKDQLQAAVDKDEITYAAIQETIRLGDDRKHWLVFGTGIQHCEHISSTLDACGVSSVMVHSKTPKEERTRAVNDFKAGRVRALVNNNVFTVGFNLPALDLIADLQPTMSPCKHVQKYGRGTRPFPGKANCLVLDFAGNTRRLGPINDPMIPKRRGKKGPGGERGAPVKLCPVCESYNHSRERFCISCKYEFPAAVVNIEAEASTADLIAGTNGGGEPVYEVFKIDRVEYANYRPHHTSGKPKSLKVDYYSGPLRQFSEWQCFEHVGWASKRARDWWREAADDHTTEPPGTIDEALTRLNEIRRPSHLKIWVNRKDPKIAMYDYTGSAFGTEIPKHFV